MRVLLADDHSIVRRGLRGLLEAAGLSVVAEAGDGIEAVRLCEAHSPDMLVLDIAMPKLNGIEVAARAQKLERKLVGIQRIQRAKSILMAGHALSEDAAYQSLRKQAMSKRISMEEMADAIIHANDALNFRGNAD